jgi:hypothetical protein
VPTGVVPAHIMQDEPSVTMVLPKWSHIPACKASMATRAAAGADMVEGWRQMGVGTARHCKIRALRLTGRRGW